MPFSRFFARFPCEACGFTARKPRKECLLHFPSGSLVALLTAVRIARFASLLRLASSATGGASALEPVRAAKPPETISNEGELRFPLVAPPEPSCRGRIVTIVVCLQDYARRRRPKVPKRRPESPLPRPQARNPFPTYSIFHPMRQTHRIFYFTSKSVFTVPSGFWLPAWPWGGTCPSPPSCW